RSDRVNASAGTTRTPGGRRRTRALVCCSLLVGAAAVTPATSADLRLIEAIKRQDSGRATALLDQRIDVNAAEPDGATALHWAVHWDDGRLVERLIAARADVNAANQLGVTPLSMAC